MIGANVKIGCPNPEFFSQETIDLVRKWNEFHGSESLITDSPTKAVKRSKIIYTDVHKSMGQEEKPSELFLPFMVNRRLMEGADDEAVIMHCMPIKNELEPELYDLHRKTIQKQARNRSAVMRTLYRSILT
jgi:ornithine carbamoyltransferase